MLFEWHSAIACVKSATDCLLCLRFEVLNQRHYIRFIVL